MAAVKLDIFRSKVPGSVKVVATQVIVAVGVEVADMDIPEVVDGDLKEVEEANIMEEKVQTMLVRNWWKQKNHMVTTCLR